MNSPSFGERRKVFVKERKIIRFQDILLCCDPQRREYALTDGDHGSASSGDVGEIEYTEHASGRGYWRFIPADLGSASNLAAEAEIQQIEGSQP